MGLQGCLKVSSGCFEEKVKTCPPEDGEDDDGGKLIKVHCGAVPTPHKLPLSVRGGRGVNLAQTE